jgi:hypothetical protein
MVYVIPNGTSWSCLQAVCKPVWHIALLCVQWQNSWWCTEELSETCRVSFQNKTEKLVHLVGLTIQNLSWCMVTWMSNLFSLGGYKLPSTRMSHYCVPQHTSFQGAFITQKVCIWQEFGVRSSPAVQNTSLRREVLKCWHPASEEAT